MENGEFSLSRGDKRTWTHIRISGAMEWHTAEPQPDATVARNGEGTSDDQQGKPLNRSHAMNSEAMEAHLSPTNGGRNLFRMTDSLADKTFAFAPTGNLDTPPLGPFGLRRRAVSEGRSSRRSGCRSGGGSGIVGLGHSSSGGSGALASASSDGYLLRHVSVPSAGDIGECSPIPGILRRRLDREVEHGLTPAEFAVRREGKLLLVMIGLPARGKTYIAHSIKRHMDWFGLRTGIFNAGNYRRKASHGGHAPASLFEPSNEEGSRLRKQCAEMALNDALRSLASKNKGVYIAIFDATNSTKSRRAWIKQKVEQQKEHVKIVCVETVLTDDQKVWENVKDAKLNSPDYKGMAPEEVMEDFFKRIAAYKSVYEPCSQEEGLSFIRLTNAGEEVVGYKAQGFLCARIMQLMGSLRLSLKPILLTRCGESEFEAQGRVGGDSRLTHVGHLYAKALARGILQGRKRFGIMPVVWTSTLLRARQTVRGLRRVVSDANEMEDVFAEDDSEEEIESEGRGGEKGQGPEQGRARGGMGKVLWQAPFSPPPPPSPPPPSPTAGSSFIGDLDVLEVSALDEIDAGAMEGMFSDDFAKIFPDHYQKRLKDKLNVKFPEGESYRDVFTRLESLLLELVAEPQPVVIVAHLAVLRVIYGYLKGVEPAKCPHIKIPMHCVLQLNPKGYGYEEWRHYPLTSAEDDEQPV